MAWLWLLLASVFEVGWAVGLKLSEGFTRGWVSVATVASMIASLLLLSLAVRTLPLGTAYAIWTGVGAVGAVTMGIAVFGEPASVPRLLCVGLIVAGVVGLKVTTPDEARSEDPSTP